MLDTKMPAEQPLIQIRGLYKLFGQHPKKMMERVHSGQSKDQILQETGHTLGLRDINIDVHAGEIFVIMGLSGSGKSTLIRHFNRLIEPTAGAILVEGTDITEFSPKELEAFRRQKMSMVFQRFGLMPHRTVIDNVAYGLTVKGMDKKARLAKAQQWLDIVGLSGYEQQFPSQLSGGQQQRVGLARALCTDADILLMDEAFSALDPLIRSEMQDQLIELQSRLEKTIVFITHDLDEALRLGDRIAILKDGELVQQGAPEEILLQPATDYVEAFVKDVNRARALTVETVMKPPECRITAETIDGALKQMRQSSEDFGYYINDHGYQGVIRQESLEQAIESGNHDDVSSIPVETVPAIQADSLLETVIPETLDTDFPLPVLDDDGQLQGMLSRSSIAQVLGDVSVESRH